MAPLLFDGQPLFGQPQNWVYRFNFEAANCNGSNGPSNQSVSGTLLVSSEAIGLRLARVSQTHPNPSTSNMRDGTHQHHTTQHRRNPPSFR